MIKQSQKHLADNNERYFQHQHFALRYAASCFIAAIEALIHGLIPAYFQTSASKRIAKLHKRKRTD